MNTIRDLPTRWAGELALAGGLLWIAYAILAMLQPLGRGATFTNDLGQTLVTNPHAFRLTGAACGGALALLGLAVVGAAARYELPTSEPKPFGVSVPSRFGVPMGWVGALAGVATAATALLLLVLPTAAMQLFGAVLVALSAMLVAIEANGSDHAYPIATPLFVVGALGMLSLVAQALLPLTTWMLPVYAALVMAVYGLAWVRFGNFLSNHRQSGKEG
ncbi:MAG: hypothetical protein IAE81_17775 [Caldilineaceae bacterium]|nr:hypothetical protein [Caldilineaceae bacterium]